MADPQTSDSDSPSPGARPGKARSTAMVAGGLLLALILAVFSLAPTVPEPARPSGRDVAVAHAVIEEVKAAQRQAVPVRLSLDDRELGALSLLAGDASQLGRVAAHVDEGQFTVRASFPLPLGLWINTETRVTGVHQGFPTAHSKLGRVPLPPTASRWLADFLRWVLLRKGVELPELDELFRHFSVDGESVATELALPGNTGLVGNVVRAAGSKVDERLVGQIYCRLTMAQAEQPDLQLTSLVRAAFVDNGAEGRREYDPEYNRAALTALAIYVVGEEATALSAIATAEVSRCPRPGGEIVLRERADLAKHWALSAALTGLFGEQTAVNLGEWKELHDSLADGSGFSFVDLAADRSGVHVARQALDPQSAEATARMLASVSEDDLLPATLTQVPEGLSETEFADRFGGIDAQRYKRAVDLIDRQLGVRTTAAPR